jgi:hypothetical protein
VSNIHSLLQSIKDRADLSWLPASERARQAEAVNVTILTEDIPRLLAAVEAVLKRHRVTTVGSVDYCRADLLVWPCDDVRAITAALESR